MAQDREVVCTGKVEGETEKVRMEQSCLFKCILHRAY